MLRLVALFAVLAVGSAQFPPPPCVSPPQWEAHYRHFDPNEGHQFEVFGRYHYDKTNLRKATFEEVDEGRNSTYRFLQVIELFAEKKRYEIDVRTRECRVVPLIRPGALDGFHPHDVPEGAHYRGLFYIGVGSETGASLEFSDWSYYYPDRYYYWEGSFTTHDCIPYRSNNFNHTTFGSSFEEFWDVSIGISDPNVFIPPPQCGR